MSDVERLSEAELAALDEAVELLAWEDIVSEDDYRLGWADGAAWGKAAGREEAERAVYLEGLAKADVVLANAEIELLNRQIEAERAETAREKLRADRADEALVYLEQKVKHTEAVTARLRADLGRAVDALDTIMLCVITKPSEATLLGIDGVCRHALKQARAALAEVPGE